MADSADVAAKLQAEEIQHSLQRRRDNDGLLYNGRCYNCEEQVESPLRFCDADCREDWEKRNRPGGAR